MYPYVITWNKNVAEYFDETSRYDFVWNDTKRIDERIFEIIEELIESHYDKLNFHSECGITWENFCQCVNAEPYNTSIFFSIKYWNSDCAKWCDYVMEDFVLEREFIKIASKYFDKKVISYSNEFVSPINKANQKKINKTKIRAKTNLIVEI